MKKRMECKRTWNTAVKSWFIFLLMSLPLWSLARITPAGIAEKTILIKTQIGAHRGELYYPNSVERFYQKIGYRLLWTAKSGSQVYPAMLLLDCVLHFGLNHSDYHPGLLTYDRLKPLMENPTKTITMQQAGFDIFMTDALLSVINHLHYGKLNPDYPAAKIDAGKAGSFSAIQLLLKYGHEKDLIDQIAGVQPQMQAYQDLQAYTTLVKGQYAADCYEFPEDQIRKMAINMERLRWISISVQTYVHINIPSSSLIFHTAGDKTVFKFTGGTALLKPAFKSKLTGFSISADPKRLVFHFMNRFGWTLQGISDQKNTPNLPNKEIRMAQGEAFARCLLEHDGVPAHSFIRAMKINKQTHFLLKKQVPILLSYLTCEVLDGQLVIYPDVYDQDAALEQALYGSARSIAKSN